MSSIMIVVIVSQVHTYTEAYQTGHFKNTSVKLFLKSSLKSFIVRFLSVLTRSLSIIKFREEGLIIQTLVSKSHSQARPASLRGTSSKQRSKANVAPFDTENCE